MNENVVQLNPTITIHYDRKELVEWLRTMASQIETDTQTPVAIALLVRRADGQAMVQATGFCDNERAVTYFTRAMGDRLGWA